MGEGSRFVKGDFRDGSQAFQGIPFPHKKAMLGGIADGSHDGRGCGQHKGTGAEYHQDRDGADQLPGDDAGQNSGSQGDDHDPCGKPVGESDDFGLSGVGRLHKPDHTLDGTVFSDFGSFHVKGTELIDRAAQDTVSDTFIHRKGLAGHDGLIDGSLTGQDGSVHWNGLSEDADAVAYFYLFGGEDGLFLSRQDTGGPRRQMHQLFDSGPGACHCQIFQKGAQLHDECHFTGCEIFPDAYGSNQRNGHQNIRFDVKGRDKADDGFQDNRDAA